MIARMLILSVSVAFTGFAVGVTQSSFKHYYHMFAEGQDRTKIDQYEVIVVEDKTKTTRRKKS